MPRAALSLLESPHRRTFFCFATHLRSAGDAAMLGPMDTFALFALCVIAALFWNWWSDRSAAELAIRVAHKACTDAGVTWLDQNVQRVRKRLARSDEGRLTWQRDFDFEFSANGDERQIGRVSLVGSRVVGLIGPDRAPTLYVGGARPI